jgi:hypothetical protein
MRDANAGTNSDSTGAISNAYTADTDANTDADPADSYTDANAAAPYCDANGDTDPAHANSHAEPGPNNYARADSRSFAPSNPDSDSYSHASALSANGPKKLFYDWWAGQSVHRASGLTGQLRQPGQAHLAHLQVHRRRLRGEQQPARWQVHVLRLSQ